MTTNNIVTSLIIGAVVLAPGMLTVVASAQTTLAVSEFHRDIEKGKQDIQGDPVALETAREVNGEDSEKAGDAHGDSNEVDGEKSDNEIENEIENEVESEGADKGTTEGVESVTSGENGSKGE